MIALLLDYEAIKKDHVQYLEIEKLGFAIVWSRKFSVAFTLH